MVQKVAIVVDHPVVKYRIGMLDDAGVNPSYDPNARKRRMEEEEWLNHEIEARRVQAIDAKKGYRILSLSRTPDNMVMWAHYASNSKGFASELIGGKRIYSSQEPPEPRKHRSQCHLPWLRLHVGHRFIVVLLVVRYGY